MSQSPFSPWPYVIIASFVLLAIFDSYIVTVALQTSTGTIEDRPYQAGLDYEKVVQAKRASQAINASLSMQSSENEIEFKLIGLPSGSNKVLEVRLIRPDSPSLDQSFHLESSTNLFLKKLETRLKRGLWMIQAHVEMDSKEYYFEFRQII